MLRGALVTGPTSLAVAAPAVAAPIPAEGSSPYNFIDPNVEVYQLPDAEIQRLSSLVVVLLAGFLTAGWFLSRAYTMSVFLYTGIVAVVYRMGRNRGIVPPPMSIPRASRAALIACVGLIALVWIILRADHLMPQ